MQQPNMQKMMKQLAQMQQDMESTRAQLADEVVSASAGGGMVKVEVTGALEVRSIKIDPQAVDPQDVEMLEDMIQTAVGEAVRGAQELAEKKYSGLTQGLGSMGIPGLPGL